MQSLIKTWCSQKLTCKVENILVQMRSITGPAFDTENEGMMYAPSGKVPAYCQATDVSQLM